VRSRRGATVVSLALAYPSAGAGASAWAGASPPAPPKSIGVEKLLEDGCIKLSAVITDIFGLSSRDMLPALATGERNPKVVMAWDVGTGTAGTRPSAGDMRHDR
jgi:hypothetical protein